MYDFSSCFLLFSNLSNFALEPVEWCRNVLTCVFWYGLFLCGIDSICVTRVSEVTVYKSLKFYLHKSLGFLSREWVKETLCQCCRCLEVFAKEYFARILTLYMQLLPCVYISSGIPGQVPLCIKWAKFQNWVTGIVIWCSANSPVAFTSEKTVGFRNANVCIPAASALYP